MSGGQPTDSVNGEAATDAATGFLDLATLVATHLRRLTLVPLAAGVVAWLIGFAMGPVFTASAVVLPAPQQQGAAGMLLQQLGSLGGLAGAAGLKNPNDQYMALLKTRSVVDALIDKFDLQARYQQAHRMDTRKLVDNNTRISAGRDGLITIEFTDRDPVFAAQVANAYVDELSRLLKSLALTEAQQRRLFFERQLALAKSNLDKAESALKASGVNSSVLKGRPEAAVSTIAILEARISTQEVKLGVIRGYLSDTAPEFVMAQNELSSLRAQLAKAARPSVEGPGASDYIARYREFKYYETMFELMARQYEIARIDESRDSASIQVVDKAEPPERRSGPKRALMAIVTTLATGFLLLVWLLLRHNLEHAGRDPARTAAVQRLVQSLRRSMFRR